MTKTFCDDCIYGKTRVKWIPVSDPLKELPKHEILWVTFIDEFPGGCIHAVDTLYYDMTKWSNSRIAENTIAYAYYHEPDPYMTESEDKK